MWTRLRNADGFVFIGDSGQGDAIFAARAAGMPGTDMKRIFIHNVTDLNKAQRAHLAAKGVHIFETYVGAATEAYKSGLISWQACFCALKDELSCP